jgi:hypothetical protein
MLTALPQGLEDAFGTEIGFAQTPAMEAGVADHV